LGAEIERFPVIVTVFEPDRDGEFAARMKELGVNVGPYDASLNAYSVLASVE
jgi:hypothetical protein